MADSATLLRDHVTLTCRSVDRIFLFDRTRSRLDVPILRTLFGAKRRPGRNGTIPQTIGKLADMVDRFTTLDSVDVTYIGDELLDQLPAAAQVGATRVGRVDGNKNPASAPPWLSSSRSPRPPRDSPSPSSQRRSTR